MSGATGSFDSCPTHAAAPGLPAAWAARAPWLTASQPSGRRTSRRKVIISSPNRGSHALEPDSTTPSSEMIPGVREKDRAYSCSSAWRGWWIFPARRSTAASRWLSPPPPYSRGQVGTVQPRSPMRCSHSRCASLWNLKRLPPQQTSTSLFTGSRISGGQFASSQARVSRRNASIAVVSA